MANETADAVKKSLGRCLMNGDVFSTFYDIFLEGDPRIPELFANTQWEEQKRLLRQGVNNVIAFYDGSVTAQSSMDRIRHTHRRAGMDIPPGLYDVWVDSMVEAVRRHDPRFDNGLATGWREILNYGADYIRAGYEE